MYSLLPRVSPAEITSRRARHLSTPPLFAFHHNGKLRDTHEKQMKLCCSANLKSWRASLSQRNSIVKSSRHRLPSG